MATCDLLQGCVSTFKGYPQRVCLPDPANTRYRYPILRPKAQSDRP